MKKLLKILFSFIFLITLQLFYAKGVSASSINTRQYTIPASTIVNLDEYGSQLQYSKKDLGNEVIDSTVVITEVKGDFPKFQLLGYVATEYDSVPFHLEGSLKNDSSFVDESDRVIFSAIDLNDNFEVIDISYYGDIEFKTFFNYDSESLYDSSVITMYLLNKNTRDLTLSEVKANTYENNNIVNILEKKDVLESADEKDVYWTQKVIKTEYNPIIEVTQDESIGNTRWTPSYTSYNVQSLYVYSYMGVEHRDYIELKLHVWVGNLYNPSTNGQVEISVNNAYVYFPATGEIERNFSIQQFGRKQDIIIELYLEGNNSHGFHQTITSGIGDIYYAPKMNFSWGIGIPNTGISIGLEWGNKQNVSIGSEYSLAYSNYPASNKYTRAIQLTYKSGITLDKQSHKLITNFVIQEFSSRLDGKVTAKFRLPLYNIHSGASSIYRDAFTVKYYNYR